LITSIPSTFANLRKLSCNDCPLLVSIPIGLTTLNEIFCENCPLLLRVPSSRTNKFRGCYWLDQNRQATVLRVKQKLMRHFYFKRWIKTREFNEWFFHPNNFGGYKHKLQLERSLEAQKNHSAPEPTEQPARKKQRKA
jgi:hypothetical protein